MWPDVVKSMELYEEVMKKRGGKDYRELAKAGD